MTRNAAPRSRLLTVLVTVSLLGAAACGGPVRRFEEPAQPIDAISHAAWDALLARYVDDAGRVDYPGWRGSAADVEALETYVAQLAHATPDTHGALFPSRAHRLAYWMNLYNALVVHEVLRRWPIGSVTDVTSSLLSHAVEGMGFFYDLEFVVGGVSLNLYDLENEIIRGRFAEARIHFTINCASASCPLLRAEALTAARLEEQLEAATIGFVNDGTNVRVDSDGHEVALSKIFEWYEDDFLTFERERGVAEPTLLDFVRRYADGPLATPLGAAQDVAWDVSFADYDWSVNVRSSAR